MYATATATSKAETPSVNAQLNPSRPLSCSSCSSPDKDGDTPGSSHSVAVVAYPSPWSPRGDRSDQEDADKPVHPSHDESKRVTTRLPRDIERKQHESRPVIRVGGSRKNGHGNASSTALMRTRPANGSFTVSIPNIAQHRAHRQQLLNNVIVSTGPRSSMALHTSTISYVQKLDLSAPIIQAALDSFIYGEIAFRYRDVQSMTHAHAAYGSALSLLAKEIANPSSQTPPARRQSVLTAIMLLIYCTTFNEVEGARVAQHSLSASHAHIHGGIRYILSGQELPTSAYDWILVQQLRHPSFWQSLFVGVPDPFATDEWMQAAAMRDSLYTFRPEDRSYMRLHDTLQTLPELVQRIGRLVASSDQADQALQLYQQAQRLREKLRAWVTQQLIETGSIGYEVVPLAIYPRFRTKTKNSLYQKVYSFSNVWAAIFYCTMWYSCIVIDTSMHEILKLRLFDDVIILIDEACITQDQIACSRHICCAMPYSYENSLTLPFYPPNFAFQQATSIFDRECMAAESQWCEDAQKIFDVSPPSLGWVIEGARSPPFQKRRLNS